MPFMIVQTSPLVLTDNHGNLIEVLLTEVGDHKFMDNKKYKDDRENVMVVFAGEIEQVKIEVEVIYSIGNDGHKVQSADVVKIPDNLTIETNPTFEAQDLEDEDDES